MPDLSFHLSRSNSQSPRHLLGKKSWNVYNADNIARVQRDEASAQAREEAREQRMQELDAARRLAILRGETPPPIPEDEEEDLNTGPSARQSLPSEKRKRKRAGEDDTDFEMRLVKERAEIGDRVSRELAIGASTAKKPSTEVALVDSAGHISLFQPPIQDRRRKEKNEEFEREEAKKKREFEDQYQMRLVNAAGKDGVGLTDGGPWYSAPDGDSTLVVPSKNVFGRDDPGRKSREAARLDASDPLAMMKSGAAKVRQLEKERKKANEEREEELRALRKEDRRREKRRQRTTEDDGKDHHDGRSSRDRHSRSERTGHSEHRTHDRSRDRRHSRERDHERRHRDDDKHHHGHHHDRSQRSEDDRHRHKRHRRESDTA